MTIQISTVTSLVRQYYQHVKSYESQENKKNEHKEFYKQLFNRFIRYQTSEEIEGLMHSLQSIKKVDTESIDIGIGLQKASKWLKNKDHSHSGEETPRKTPRKSGHNQTKVLIEDIVRAAKVYQSVEENLSSDAKYLEGESIKTTLLELFKSINVEERKDLVTNIQRQLNAENMSKTIVNVSFCMLQVLLLAEKVERKCVKLK